MHNSPVTLTSEAVSQLKEVLKDEKPGFQYVRFSVTGGGCAGYNYSIDIDNEVDPDEDSIYEQDGVSLVVDCYSSTYLQSTTVDYTTSLMGSGFKFINNAHRTCGCSSSFSVK